MTRVLIVDDDRSLARALAINLGARGYQVDVASNGRTALQLADAQAPDLVILDLGLPDLDGLEVLVRLRAWTTVPVLVLSAREGQADKVAALDAGADDYLTKPFGMDELLARLRAASRRAAPAADLPAVVTDDFTVDLAARRVINADGDVRLTPTEWNLLDVLVRQAGKVVTQRQLLTEVWGHSYETETHYLRVYIAQLRRKLEADPSKPRYLITATGVGYRFQP